MVAAAAAVVHKTCDARIAPDSFCDMFKPMAAEPATEQSGDSTSFHQVIYFSTGTRPIFNINSSKFPRTDSSNFNYSKISISSPDSTIGTSVVGIADPLLQHPFRNCGPEGAGSRRANLGESSQVPENAEITTRGPKKLLDFKLFKTMPSQEQQQQKQQKTLQQQFDQQQWDAKVHTAKKQQQQNYLFRIKQPKTKQQQQKQHVKVATRSLATAALLHTA